MAWYVNYTSIMLLKNESKTKTFSGKKRKCMGKRFFKKKLYLKWESLQKPRN